MLRSPGWLVRLCVLRRVFRPTDGQGRTDSPRIRARIPTGDATGRGPQWITSPETDLTPIGVAPPFAQLAPPRHARGATVSGVDSRHPRGVDSGLRGC